MMKPTLALLMIVCFLTSCKEEVYYSSAKAFEEAGWSYEDIHKATFEVIDSSRTFDLFLDIEHSPLFEYQNIYCKLSTVFPSGKKTEQQLPINFADNKGMWYGKCSSSECKLRVVLQQNVAFKEPGSYTITFEQFSRKPVLEEISSIDFIIK